MKKIIVLLIMIIALCGCGNKNIGIGQHSYYYVNCRGPIEYVNEKITSWKDFEGEQIEITLTNGNTLLVSANYCALSNDKVLDENLGE